MTNRRVLAFVAGVLIALLAMVAVRVALAESGVGYHMHPIMGLLGIPLVFSFSTCIGGLVVFTLSRFLRLAPGVLGAAAFGCWCTLPLLRLIEGNPWIAMLLSAPLVPLMLGASRRSADTELPENPG